MRHQRLGRQPAQPCRNDIAPLGAFGTDLHHLAAAAGAEDAVELEDLPDPLDADYHRIAAKRLAA